MGFATFKARGEWVEMRFMARASEEGLQVSKPYGESATYDFIVEFGQRCLRVQVKSSSYIDRGGYSCRVRHASGDRVYPANSFDFAAVYLIAAQVWYIIPTAKITGCAYLYLVPGNGKSKYGDYEEAWGLMRQLPSAGALT